MMRRAIILTTAIIVAAGQPAAAQFGMPNYGGGSGDAGAYGNGYGSAASGADAGLQTFPLGAPVNTIPQTYQPATGGLGSGFAQYGVNSLPAAPIIPTMTNHRYDLRPDVYQYWTPPKLRDTSGVWKNGATDDRWLNTKTSATMGGAAYNLDPLPRSGEMYDKQVDYRFGGSSMEDSAYGRLLRRLDADEAKPGQVKVNGKPVEMPKEETEEDERMRPRGDGRMNPAPAKIQNGIGKPMQPQMQGTFGEQQAPE